NGFQLEALYQRQDTKIESHLGGVAYYPQLDNDGISWNVSASYIQLGGIQNVIVSEDQKVVPFLGLSLGALWFENHEAGYEDTWKFAWGLKGGAKVRINDKIGFKGTASLYS